MKASEKANNLIGEFSTSTERTALSPSNSMFSLYCLAREDLEDYIAELEMDNAEFRQLIRDWSIVLEQDDGFQLWHVESVRQAMLEINKESEE